MNLSISSRGLIALCSLALALTACEKVEERAVVSVKSAPALTASATTLAVDVAKQGQELLTLSWTKADLGYANTPIKYELVFTNPALTSSPEAVVEVGVGVLKHTLTHLDFNTICTNTLGMDTGVPAKVKVAVRAMPLYASSVRPSASVVATSSLVELTATPADITVVSESYFFVGSTFGDPSWNNTYTGFPFFVDATDASTYTYTGKFAGGGFKIFAKSALGDWGKSIGKDSDGTLKADGGNIDISAGGYYTFSFSPSGKTYSLSAFDASKAPSYTSIKIEGSASSATLAPTAYDPHIWVADGVVFKAGTFTFAGSGSAVWGGSKFPQSKALLANSTPIKVTAERAGTYRVLFNDLTGHFHCFPK